MADSTDHYAELLRRGYKPTKEDWEARDACTRHFFRHFTVGAVGALGATVALAQYWPKLGKSRWKIPTIMLSTIVGGQLASRKDPRYCLHRAMEVDSPLGAIFRETAQSKLPHEYQQLPEELRAKTFDTYPLPDLRPGLEGGEAMEGETRKGRGGRRVKPKVSDLEPLERREQGYGFPAKRAERQEEEYEQEEEEEEEERDAWSRPQPRRSEEGDFRRPAWRDGFEKGEREGRHMRVPEDPESGRKYFEDEQQQQQQSQRRNTRF